MTSLSELCESEEEVREGDLPAALAAARSAENAEPAAAVAAYGRARSLNPESPLFDR